MSTKTFCDLCGAEIHGNPAKIIVVSAEYEARYGRITSNDAMDACDECYARIRGAVQKCGEGGKHERN